MTDIGSTIRVARNNDNSNTNGNGNDSNSKQAPSEKSANHVSIPRPPFD